MLNTNFLGFKSLHPRLYMEELLRNRPRLLINLLLRYEGLGGQPKLIIMLHINNQKDWILGILPKNLIDLYIMRFKTTPRSIPSYESLLLSDFLHHLKHILMI